MKNFAGKVRHLAYLMGLYKARHLWRRFQARSGAEQWLFFQCICLLPGVAGMLRWFRFKRVQMLMAKLSPTIFSAPPNDRLEHVEMAYRCVRMAARVYRGRFTCLPQALLLWWLLRRWKLPCELRFGVRHVDEKYEAHAWVEYAGRALEPTSSDPFVPFEQPIRP